MGSVANSYVKMNLSLFGLSRELCSDRAPELYYSLDTCYEMSSGLAPLSCRFRSCEGGRDAAGAGGIPPE